MLGRAHYHAAMAKYDPLKRHLRACCEPRITMSFDQIAALVGGLPRSAHDYHAWWANETNPTTHVQNFAWMDAGYRVERLNLGARTVTFARRS
jgi:hypothetical protein